MREISFMIALVVVIMVIFYISTSGQENCSWPYVAVEGPGRTIVCVMGYRP